MNLFASYEGVEILFPELAKETQSWMAAVEIDDKFNTEHFPQMRQRDPAKTLPDSHVGIKGKDGPLVDKVAERITI